MRTQFTFYKSFDDVIEDLSDKQVVEYIKTLLDVQFLRVRIDDVRFDDKILNAVWKAQKHTISTSIEGYLNSQKRHDVSNPFLGVYCTPSEGGRQQDKDKEEDKEKDKEKEEVQYDIVELAESIPYSEIISHLNSLAKTNYKPSGDKTRSLIKARWNDGFTLDDFIVVHTNKVAEWYGTDMEKYLRPETLYSNKFEGYLNQKLSAYEKSKAIQEYTGMSANELLQIQMEQAQKEWDALNGVENV